MNCWIALVTCCITVSLSCFLAASLRRSFFMVCKLQNVFQIIVSPDLYLENWACLTTHTHLERRSHCPAICLTERGGASLPKIYLQKVTGNTFAVSFLFCAALSPLRLACVRLPVNHLRHTNRAATALSHLIPLLARFPARAECENSAEPRSNNTGKQVWQVAPPSCSPNIYFFAFGHASLPPGGGFILSTSWEENGADPASKQKLFYIYTYYLFNMKCMFKWQIMPCRSNFVYS